MKITNAQFRLLRTFNSQMEYLSHIQRALHRLDEKFCNSCSLNSFKRDENRLIKLEKEAEKIANLLGMHAYHQTDPRGASLYLTTNKKNQSQNYYQGIVIN